MKAYVFWIVAFSLMTLGRAEAESKNILGNQVENIGSIINSGYKKQGKKFAVTIQYCLELANKFCKYKWRDGSLSFLAIHNDQKWVTAVSLNLVMDDPLVLNFTYSTVVSVMLAHGNANEGQQFQSALSTALEQVGSAQGNTLDFVSGSYRYNLWGTGSGSYVLEMSSL